MKNKIDSQSLLSTLWIFILFNMIFRDLHEFLNHGYIEELMSKNLSEGIMLFYGVVLEIPILMVLLSRVLKNRANKWLNIVAASVIMLGALSTLPDADLDDVFFTIVNAVALLAIIYTAWKLPSHVDSKSATII